MTTIITLLLWGGMLVFGLKFYQSYEQKENSLATTIGLLSRFYRQKDSVIFVLSQILSATLIWYNTDGMFRVYTLVLVVLLITMAFIDIKTFLLPNKLMFPVMLISFFGGFFFFDIPWYLLTVLSMTFIAFSLALIRMGAFGGGDVKLLMVLSMLLGSISDSIAMLLIGLVLGGIVSFFLLQWNLLTRKGSIPYGPMFVISYILIVCFG